MEGFILLISGVAIGFLVAIFYLNVRYYRKLIRMTPDERKQFKQAEREDLQTW
jgi:hypothetical protein